MARIHNVVIFLCFVAAIDARYRKMNLFNWSYKDFDVNTFSDHVSEQRQTFADFPTAKCPDGWIYFSDSCYWIEQEKFSFAEAEQRCYEKNATLLVINSEAEWDSIRDHTPTAFYSWIGLVRLTQNEKCEDTPRWQTEGAINATEINWLVKPYEPATNGWSSLANCVAHFNPALNLDSVAFSYYYPCNYEYHSICERNNTILDFLHRKFDFQV